MPSEHTPLLNNVRVGPARRHGRRPRRTVLRRFCAVALSSTLLWMLIVFFVALLTWPDWPGLSDCPDWPDDRCSPRHGHGQEWSWSWSSSSWSLPSATRRTIISHEELQKILLEVPSPDRAEEWSRYYTAGPHLAGKNYSQALWTQQKWESWGIKSDIVAYDVYLNYPVDHRLALLRQEGGTGQQASGWKVAFEASLEEDVLEEDGTSGLKDRIPTFHGYSATGNVTGPVVYVNYGSYQDFEDLVKANVSLAGKIAIARYGGIFRGLKIKRAQELGMIGTILYSDPGDDGRVTVENGFKPYPQGPARQPSSVQRGSAQFLSFAPGDPSTPGYPSKPGAPRVPTDEIIAKIPSLPISYTDALPILMALNGHGPKAKDFNRYWTRNTGLEYRGVEYNIGPTPDHVVVNLYSEQEYVTTPLWDVIGVINGSIPDEVVVVGNHRDAWVAGGAGDPNSGSAVLNEVIRSFGVALAAGWKPLRTIVFASWDGEEYGLIGSTEWVEEFIPWISATNVAYINIDVGATGTSFAAAAAPLLDNVIYAATAAVRSPNQTVPGQTVRDVWDGRIATMGSGSDFTAFQDFAGVPCINIGFQPGPGGAVYHYHSNYDSFHWMAEFGDPGFLYHHTAAQLMGLMTAQVADLPVLSFRAFDYAKALSRYVKQVEAKLKAKVTTGFPSVAEGVEPALLPTDAEYFALRAQQTRRPDSAPSVPSGATAASFEKSLARLHAALGKLTPKAAALDARADSLEGEAEQTLPWWKWPSKLWLAYQIRTVNTKYKFLERNFLYAEGLDGRPWFKHVVFAPGLWTGYAGAVFPGLVESIDTEDWPNAERWVTIIETSIASAEKSL